MIAALFVETNGAYFGLPDVDPWDEPRDARKYAGPHPVVAHPPCSRWCQMANVNQLRWGYKIGEDDGCFSSALASVRHHGGVLEHPAKTMAFAAFGLPRPLPYAWTKDAFDSGWVCEVGQRAYGHLAQKLTWLYFVGNYPPRLDWRRPRPVARIGHNTRNPNNLPSLRGARASATPDPFRDMLLAMAASVKA